MSGELSTEAIEDWVQAGNTNPSALLSSVADIRINHAQGHAHLSQLGTAGGTNELLIGYYVSHFWAGDIPNSEYDTQCNQHTSAGPCNTQTDSFGFFICRWDTEVFGGRCLKDRCTHGLGFAPCSSFEQCEFRNNVCRVRPTVGGARFTKADLNLYRPWCAAADCI